MYTVLVTSRSFGQHSKQPIERLEALGCRLCFLRAGEKSLADQLAEQIGEADAIVAGLEVYDEALLRRATKLKIIARNGVGVDSVDLAAARALGIKVATTPGANADSVADMAMALMLAGARHIPAMDAGVRAGTGRRTAGVEMWRKTIGIVGTGRIGQGVALRARGFQMEILCHDVHEDKDFARDCGATYLSLDELCRRADFITIHTPLLDGTRGLIGARELKLMKKTAVLVNTARGGIVDEEALCHALSTGGIGAAGLDATAVEPLPADHPLLRLENCTVTPHMGANTIDAVDRMGALCAQSITQVLSGQDCPCLI